MAVFKVGQRVKYVGDRLNPRLPTGAEGIVLCSMPGITRQLVYQVDFPRHALNGGSDWIVFPESLAPLTDPQADAFVERMKKLGREPVNSPGKVIA